MSTGFLLLVRSAIALSLLSSSLHRADAEESIVTRFHLNCREESGNLVDDRQILRVYNNELYGVEGDKFDRIQILGEKLVIINKAGKFEYAIDEIIGGNDEDLDIELSFSFYKSTLYLYWRETFRNKIAKHGLMNLTYFVSISNQYDVDLLEMNFCSGLVGANVAH